MAGTVVVVPGQRISKVEDGTEAGQGTYTRGGYVYSSLAGFLRKAPDGANKTLIEVQTDALQTVVPSVGSVVTARVTNVNPRFCKCNILSVEKAVLREPFRGMIRKEDVRATEKDKVEMYKCFRPGDLVLARVLSLGDAHSYILTTAENELGIVVASSEAGVGMVPISWCEMQCPKTLAKEQRKVAKIQPEHLVTTKR